ncbi:hypothetical protein DRN46_03110 [Thermococci archaeon]|nr:MAG: hypothetical protein DRN46_03110 [Thermococci archaeon]
MGKLIVCLHNVHSGRKVEEIAKLSFSLGCDLLVISKPSGTAAQVGVPIASRIAFESEKSLLVTRDLEEAIEVLNPRKVYIGELPERGGRRKLDYEEVVSQLEEGDVMFVVSGSPPGVSSRDQELGEVVYLIERDLGSIGAVAVFLYEILKLKKEG